MAERAQVDEEDDDADNEAEPRGGDKRRRMGRDEPLPKNAAEGGVGGVAGMNTDKRRAKDVKRAQDAACSLADFALRHPEAARIRVIL